MSSNPVVVVPVNLSKHPNADSLSICPVLGYNCVCNSEAWEGKKFAAYVPPDSLVDVARPEFDFLTKEAKTSYTNDGKLYSRIKCKRLRGYPSYGLLVPAPEGSKEGDDVTQLLGVLHYQPPSEEEKAAKSKSYTSGGEVESAPNLPFSFGKYDLENEPRWPDILVQGEEVVITEKLDGSNMRLVYWDNKIHVGSRTEWKRQYPSYSHLTKEKLIEQGCTEEKAKDILERIHSSTPKMNVFWAHYLAVEDTWGKWCKENPGCVVFGEAFGPGGKLKYKPKHDFAAFDIMENGKWLDAERIFRDTTLTSIGWAPFLYRGPYDREMLAELSEGPTKVLGAKAGTIREGAVVSPILERWHDKLGRVKLKKVSFSYLERF